jgi:outer membrane protein assembly factor BamB
VEFEPQVELREVWSRDVGAGADKYYLKLVPALDEGRVFAATRKGDVSAYDAETGERLWETDTEVPIGGGPGVGSGVVVVGSTEGSVVALSPADGAILWKTRVSSEVLSAPHGVDGIVVVYAADGTLYGLNATNGEQVWIYDRGVPALTLRGTSAPAVAPGVTVCGFDSGRLVAVSINDGQPLWETRVAVPSGRSELERMVDIDGDVIISDGTVYAVTFQGRTAAVDLISGTLLWRRDMSSHAGLGISDDALYVTDTDSHVWALDRASSASLWRQDKLAARGLTSPVTFEEFVALGDSARVKVDGDGIIAPPIASATLLYVYGRSGKLVALGLDR